MKLKNALQRAAKLIGEDKTNQILRHILVVTSDSGAGLPSYLLAGDGTVWVQIRLDDGVEVIPGALNADQLAPILRDAAEIERIEWAPGGGTALLVVRSASDTIAQAELPVLPASLYPGVDLVASTDFVPEYSAHDLPGVIHAVGGDDPVAKHLGYVHASAEGLAASDGYRIALLQYAAPWRGLIPPRMFAHWPKRAAIALHVGTRTLAIRIGDDEIRHCAYAQGPYPDPWHRAGALEAHRGPRLLLWTKPLATAVKQACGVSGPSPIILRLRAGTVHVESQTGEPGRQFRTHLLGEGGEKDVDILLDGKLLHAALKAAHTPKVLLGYRRSIDPVRVEAGRLIECIWPMVP